MAGFIKTRPSESLEKMLESTWSLVTSTRKGPNANSKQAVHSGVLKSRPRMKTYIIYLTLCGVNHITVIESCLVGLAATQPDNRAC